MTDFGKRVGDMFKSTYDTDEDGTVDDAEKLEASNKAGVRDHAPKSHTHEEADITDLDHDAQKIKGVTVDAADIGDEKVLTYDLASETIKYITPAPSGAVLKSIQQVKLDLAAGAGAQDFTINSVDITKSFLIPGGTHFPHDESEYGAYTLRLKNATTIEYNRELAIGNADAYVCVVEFESGIKSIVRAVTALPAGTSHVQVDITTVDLSKAFISYLGCRSANGLGKNQVGVVYFKYAYRVYVQNPSKTAGDQWISWEMVEFE